MRSHRIYRHFLSLLLFAASFSWAAEPLTCLLTGFQPFGGAKDNPSWEMLKPLSGQTIAGYQIETVELPVLYDEMAKPLVKAIAQHQPRIVICFGQGGNHIQVERIARNGYHPANYPDNKQRRPPREQIAPDGAAEIPTRLPVDAIVTALNGASLTAAASNDAGGYLCNECFYRLMAHADTPGAKGIVTRGFIHVPQVGTRNAAGGVYTIEDLTRAVRIVIETTMREGQ
jgi:pyroglutamyl-peptidase